MPARIDTVVAAEGDAEIVKLAIAEVGTTVAKRAVTAPYEQLQSARADAESSFAVPRLLADPDPARAERPMQAILGMKKLDIAALEWAAEGTGT